MKTNMGMSDRVFRTLLAVISVVLYLAGFISGTTAIVLLSLSAVFLLTSLIGVCPLYWPFGIHTNRRKHGA